MRVSAGVEAAKDRELAPDSSRIVQGFDHGTTSWSIESGVTPRRGWHVRCSWKQIGLRIRAMLRSRNRIRHNCAIFESATGHILRFHRPPAYSAITGVSSGKYFRDAIRLLRSFRPFGESR